VSAGNEGSRRGPSILAALAIAAFVGFFFVGRSTGDDETLASPAPATEVTSAEALRAPPPLTPAGRIPRLVEERPPPVKDQPRPDPEPDPPEPAPEPVLEEPVEPPPPTEPVPTSTPPPAPQPAPEPEPEPAPAPDPSPPPSFDDSG